MISWQRQTWHSIKKYLFFWVWISVKTTLNFKEKFPPRQQRYDIFPQNHLGWRCRWFRIESMWTPTGSYIALVQQVCAKILPRYCLVPGFSDQFMLKPFLSFSIRVVLSFYSHQDSQSCLRPKVWIQNGIPYIMSILCFSQHSAMP